MITELIKTSAKPKKFCEKTELIYTGGGIWIAMSPLGENKEYMVATDNGLGYTVYPNKEEDVFVDILADYIVEPCESEPLIAVPEISKCDELDVADVDIMHKIKITYDCFNNSERY